MASLVKKQPNPWYVAVVSGMASYIDSSCIITSGTALTIYQAALANSANAISNIQFGALQSALTLCIAIASIVGGRIGDLIGRRKVFAATMVFIITGCLLVAFGSSFPVLLAGQILIGCGVGADLPVSLATISEAAPDEKRGKMLGFSDVLWVVGILVAYATGFLVGDWGLIGGRIMYGVLSVVAAIVLVLRLTIPESEMWLQAYRDRLAGKATKEERGRIGDLVSNRSYAIPFFALIVFYIGTNVPANTLGQFSTWVATNIPEIGLSVSTASLICMLVYPARALLDFVFMKFVDTDKRMPLFYMGAALYLLGYAMFPLFGFSAATFVLTQLLYCCGAAFAFESILKVWMQECFPTLLRTTANGTIVFVSRFCCSVFGLFTASIVAFDAKLAFTLLALLCVIGFAAAIWAFHGKRYNTFAAEEANRAE
ncbi:MFS transporter [Curtanaerobium respiraculi]|uniref:MFS transporter n=1 Tax=Curtanaerobium respiraculi TaxID=2949669 RepID=UPI0024B3C136|nr:MFS transporter [Curtanaerobium respiraculi]